MQSGSDSPFRLLLEMIPSPAYGVQMAFTGPAALAIAATWRPDGSERDIELGREAGFDAHLIKPVDLAEVGKLLASSNQLRSR